MEQFSEWFVLPQDSEWRKVGERTDRLGMTRAEYRQYVSGVEVEHSQIAATIIFDCSRYCLFQRSLMTSMYHVSLRFTLFPKRIHAVGRYYGASSSSRSDS